MLRRVDYVSVASPVVLCMSTLLVTYEAMLRLRAFTLRDENICFEGEAAP